MKTLDVLKGARETIRNPYLWTQRAWARNKDGGLVPFTSEDACSWCLIGAIFKQVPHMGAEARKPVFDECEKCLRANIDDGRYRGLGAFNDEHSHEDVMNLLDRTIDQLEREHEKSE